MTRKAELEKAYAEYQACKENGTEYHKRRVSQGSCAHGL